MKRCLANCACSIQRDFNLIRSKCSFLAMWTNVSGSMLITSSLGLLFISRSIGLNEFSLERCYARAGGQDIDDEIATIQPTTGAHTLEDLAS